MTNDELEAVRARALEAIARVLGAKHGGGEGIRVVLAKEVIRTDVPALLAEVKLLADLFVATRGRGHWLTEEEYARATRAEAHAERLASLMGEMFEDGPVTVGFAGNPIAIADLERRARQALSAYRGEMK